MSIELLDRKIAYHVKKIQKYSKQKERLLKRLAFLTTTSGAELNQLYGKQTMTQTSENEFKRVE